MKYTIYNHLSRFLFNTANRTRRQAGHLTRLAETLNRKAAAL